MLSSEVMSNYSTAKTTSDYAKAASPLVACEQVSRYGAMMAEM